jgi:hypothetical protein
MAWCSVKEQGQLYVYILRCMQHLNLLLAELLKVQMFTIQRNHLFKLRFIKFHPNGISF